MYFKPGLVLRSTLQFFQASGLGAPPGPSHVDSCDDQDAFHGDAQAFEQLAFILLGHLSELPGLRSSCRQTADSGFMEVILDTLSAPPGTSERLAAAIGTDPLLAAALAASRSTCTCSAPSGNGGITVTLVFPVETEPPVLSIRFDMDCAVSHFGSEEVAHGIIDSFVSRLPNAVSSFRAALDLDDLQEAHRIIHSLKGGALNIGAEPLAEIARQLESRLRGGGLPTSADLIQLEARCRDLLEQWIIYCEDPHG